MDDKKINVYVPSDYNGKPIVIEIRENTPDNNNFIEEGNLDCVLEYIKKNYYVDLTCDKIERGEMLSLDGCLIVAKEVEKPFIRFYSSKCNTGYNSIITGYLSTNERIETLKINEHPSFNHKEFIHLLRKNIDLFQDIKELERLIKTLNCRQNYPQHITIEVPLFKGLPTIDIVLEVHISGTNDKLYGFYCLELEQIKREQIEIAFDKCLTPEMKKMFTVIYK